MFRLLCNLLQNTWSMIKLSKNNCIDFVFKGKGFLRVLFIHTR